MLSLNETRIQAFVDLKTCKYPSTYQCQIVLVVCLKGKLDVESFIQYMEAAKAVFPSQPEHDEFAVSLIESIWIKHSEIPKTDVQSKDAFN